MKNYISCGTLGSQGISHLLKTGDGRRILITFSAFYLLRRHCTGQYDVSLTLLSLEDVNLCLFSLPNSMCHRLLESWLSIFCLRILLSFASLGWFEHGFHSHIHTLPSAINSDPIFKKKSSTIPNFPHSLATPQGNLNLVYFYQLTY